MPEGRRPIRKFLNIMSLTSWGRPTSVSAATETFLGKRGSDNNDNITVVVIVIMTIIIMIPITIIMIIIITMIKTV